MSKTRCLHHIVFATRHRQMAITEEHKKDLYAYIHGIIKNKRCYLHRLNGIPNHIHMLVDIHPSVALADLVKDIKQSTHYWLRNNNHFPMFDWWGTGYYAVSIGVGDIGRCREYIIQQEKHHIGTDIMQEMEHMAKENGLSWYPDDWE